MQSMDNWIITCVAGFIISFISYFLKQTITRVDSVEKANQSIKDNFVKKEDHEKDMNKLESEVVVIRRDYTPKEDHQRAYDEVRNDVKEMKENFLRKDDFLHSMSSVENKIDRLTEMFLKGRDRNG